MGEGTAFDRRRADRRLYLSIAVFFAVIVLVGFGPTYYFKFAFDAPPVKSGLVHVHGFVMTLWVIFFGVQVFLIRSKRHRVHMGLGIVGAFLAFIVVVVGFFTAAAAAKFGSTSKPPGISELAFFAVPLSDLVMFVGLFTAAILYRRSPMIHKRLMLLTVINFLPPAVARISIPQLQAAGPLFFFGLPTVITIVLIAVDARLNGTLNRPFLIGGALLIASYPLRLVVSGTDTWLSFAYWVTEWAA